MLYKTISFLLYISTSVVTASINNSLGATTTPEPSGVIFQPFIRSIDETLSSSNAVVFDNNDRAKGIRASYPLFYMDKTNQTLVGFTGFSGSFPHEGQDEVSLSSNYAYSITLQVTSKCYVPTNGKQSY